MAHLTGAQYEKLMTLNLALGHKMTAGRESGLRRLSKRQASDQISALSSQLAVRKLLDGSDSPRRRQVAYYLKLADQLGIPLTTTDLDAVLEMDSDGLASLTQDTLKALQSANDAIGKALPDWRRRMYSNQPDKLHEAEATIGAARTRLYPTTRAGKTYDAAMGNA